MSELEDVPIIKVQWFPFKDLDISFLRLIYNRSRLVCDSFMFFVFDFHLRLGWCNKPLSERCNSKAESRCGWLWVSPHASARTAWHRQTNSQMHISLEALSSFSISEGHYQRARTQMPLNAIDRQPEQWNMRDIWAAILVVEMPQRLGYGDNRNITTNKQAGAKIYNCGNIAYRCLGPPYITSPLLFHLCDIGMIAYESSSLHLLCLCFTKSNITVKSLQHEIINDMS